MLGGEGWRVGVVNLAVLACVLRTMTKNKVINFLRKKGASLEKILAMHMLKMALFKANIIVSGLWSFWPQPFRLQAKSATTYYQTGHSGYKFAKVNFHGIVYCSTTGN